MKHSRPPRRCRLPRLRFSAASCCLLLPPAASNCLLLPLAAARPWLSGAPVRA